MRSIPHAGPGLLGLLALTACPTVEERPDPASPVPTGDTDAPEDTHTPADTDDPADTDVPPGVCTHTADLWTCPHGTVDLPSSALTTREVHFQVPAGTPPAEGWPVVVLFQGSFYSAEWAWEARPTDPFGGWNQVGVVSALLDAGFAVITPEATGDGSTYWTTNVPPWSLLWETSPDHTLMTAVFDAIDDGTFGPLDGTRLFATGISSGGYMTSRMALSYPGRFRALAVHSASWATCSGALCVLPDTLPVDHPPTLFLHGELDLIAPVGPMQVYADRLAAEGHEVSVVRDPSAAHEWIDAAPDELVAWFSDRR